MSGRKAVEIKRFGLTQVYGPEDDSMPVAMYVPFLLKFDGFSASTFQRQVEMMLIYMKSGSLEPSISLELQSLDYK